MDCPSLTCFPIKDSSQICLNEKTNSIETCNLNALLGEKSYKNGLPSTLLKPVTKAIQKLDQNKRQYVNTSNKIRFELIDAVHKHGEKIKCAAKRLGINYSAAKAICQVYKKEGRGEKKVVKIRKTRQSSRLLNQDFPILMNYSDIKLKDQQVANKELILKKSHSNEENSTFSNKESFSRASYKPICLDNNYATSQFGILSRSPNMIISEPLLLSKLRPGYHIIPNTPVNDDFSSILSQQSLISGMINCSMPLTNFNLSYITNNNHQCLSNNLGYQTLGSYQDQLLNSFDIQWPLRPAITPIFERHT